VVGLVLLIGLVLAVDRLGVRLPMQTLFRVSTIVLLVTAVVLLGKGLHALQEIGALPLRPVRFVRVDFLGVFPDLVSLLPQCALAIAPIAWSIATRKRARPAPAEDAPAR
jgi:high-affinity iron transporter